MSTPPDDPDLAYLWDMREYASRAREIASGTSEAEFIANPVLRLAVERALELIGEAARRVSADRQATVLEIPWREIIGQRNVLAHEYGAVDPARLWHTAVHDTGPLIEALGRLLSPTDQ